MRVIDADALIKNRDIQIVIGAGDNICVDVADIENAPTIDAVPVVRCQDCEMQSSCKVAQHLGNNGFCSKGDRRSDV